MRPACIVPRDMRLPTDASDKTTKTACCLGKTALHKTHAYSSMFWARELYVLHM
jgi:hypothetical protein